MGGADVPGAFDINKRWKDEFGVIREEDGTPVPQGALVQETPAPGTYDDGRTGVFGKIAANISNLIGAKTYYNKDQGLVPAVKNTASGLGHLVGAFSPFTFSDPEPTGIDLGRGRGAYTRAPQVTGLQIPPALEELNNANMRAKLGKTNELDGLTIAGSAMMGGGFGMKAAEAAKLGSKVSLGDHVMARTKMLRDGPPLRPMDERWGESFPDGYPATDGAWSYAQTVPADTMRAMDTFDPPPSAFENAVSQAQNDPHIMLAAKDGQRLFSNAEDKLGMLGAFASEREAVASPQTANPQAAKPAFTRTLDQNGLYSVLDESLAKAEMKQGNAQQWLNALKKSGVKDSEIYWRGLDDFLKSKNPNEKIPKAEIEKHLKDNQVRITPHEHDEDGYTAEQLRDSELDSLTESYLEDYELRRHMADEDIEAYAAETWDVSKDPETGKYFIHQAGDPEDRAGSVNYDTEAEALADLHAMARDSYEEIAPWGAFRSGESEPDTTFDYDYSERDAKRHMNDWIYDKAQDDVSDMSAAELFRNAGVNPGQRTKDYLESTIPDDGRNYTETPWTINEETFARKGSRGWPKHDDGAHPSTMYDHSPGWTLKSDYEDVRGGAFGDGTVLHEVQSLQGQRGPKQPQHVIDQLHQAYSRLASEVQRGVHKYRAFEDGPYAVDPSQITNETYISRYNGAPAVDAFLRDAKSARYYMLELPGEIELAKTALEKGSTYDGLGRGIGDRVTEMTKDLERYTSEWNNVFAPALRRIEPGSAEYAQFADWQKQQEALRLKTAEARQAYEAASKGVEPGPFIDDNKGLPFLMKMALYNAAKRGDDFVAVTGPKRMMERWGDEGVETFYKDLIPNAMKKLIAMHDKSAAKLEHFYPGKYQKPRAEYHERQGAFGQMEFPGEPGALFGGPVGGGHAMMTQDGAYISRRHPGDAVRTNTRVRDIVLGKDDKGDPAYYLQLEDGGYIGGPMAHYAKPFKTRGAAETYMREINDQLDSLSSDPKAQQDAAVRQWEDDDEKISEPYTGVRLTPELRKKIIENGFPMFVNPDMRAGLLGAFAASQRERENHRKHSRHDNRSGNRGP